MKLGGSLVEGAVEAALEEALIPVPVPASCQRVLSEDLGEPIDALGAGPAGEVGYVAGRFFKCGEALWVGGHEPQDALRAGGFGPSVTCLSRPMQEHHRRSVGATVAADLNVARASGWGPERNARSRRSMRANRLDNDRAEAVHPRRKRRDLR